MTSKPEFSADLDAFRASRIYAEGWNAARTLSGGMAKADGLNPYATEPERSRWDEGWSAARA